MICGAAWLSHLVVSFLRGMILLAVFGETPPQAWSAAAGYTWASGTVIVFGVLYGGIVGLNLVVDRLGWWPLCLMVVAWLGAPASFGRHSFPFALSVAMAENAARAFTAVIALITFGMVRSRAQKKMVASSAR